MEQIWLFEHLAVTLTRVDFLDPALVGQDDARERGVRIEVKPATSRYEGSVYASSTDVLRPAVCRIDLLESAPHAADRMHWHPTMPEGEPGGRTFDTAIPADPTGWVSAQLSDLPALLARGGVDPEPMASDADALRDAVPDIAAAVDAGLAWARRSPWPDAVHDERGLAPYAG
jgi:hypothetical protein